VESSSLDLAKGLATVTTPPVSPHPGTGEVVVYVDASRSMRGFAGCSSNPTEFTNTLDRVTSSLTIGNVVQFGEVSKGSAVVFKVVPMGKEVRCPGFYDRLQNPDYALFKAALGDSSGRTYLYFTDGVQSDWQGNNPGPSLDLLEQWMKSGRTLAILAFRSRFDGQAWSEQSQRMIANIATTERPFYLFILAQSDEAMNRTLQKLPVSLMNTARTIRFGREAVQCKALPGDVPKYKSSSTPPWSLIEHPNIKAGKSLLDYRCDLRAEYPIAEVRPRVTLDYKKWDGKAFVAQPGPPTGSALTPLPSSGAGGGSVVRLQGSLPKDESTRYGFYAVRIEGEPGLPRTWVDSLSTDSDAQPDTFAKTYRFSWLIERLAKADLAMRPPVGYGITVKYR
jgi:hypothetical protein